MPCFKYSKISKVTTILEKIFYLLDTYHKSQQFQNVLQAGDKTRQAYEKKCLQLRNQDIRRADLNSGDKTRSGVRDLYSRILVALRAVESISEKIQKLRDEELQPQLVELIQG